MSKKLWENANHEAFPLLEKVLSVLKNPVKALKENYQQQVRKNMQLADLRLEWKKSVLRAFDQLSEKEKDEVRNIFSDYCRLRPNNPYLSFLWSGHSEYLLEDGARVYDLMEYAICRLKPYFPSVHRWVDELSLTIFDFVNELGFKVQEE